MNLYGYVGNSPINITDPYGLLFPFLLNNILNNTFQKTIVDYLLIRKINDLLGTLEQQNVALNNIILSGNGCETTQNKINDNVQKIKNLEALRTALMGQIGSMWFTPVFPSYTQPW